jgi:hypothetical protein
MGLFNKNNKRLEDNSQKEPQEDPVQKLRKTLSKKFEDARWGATCRTLSFKRSGNDVLGTEWLQASRMPDNTWSIMRCQKKDVTLSQSTKQVHGAGISQSWLLDDEGYPYNDLTFYDAIIKLSEYESTQADLGWELSDSPTEEDLGSEYYRNFALNEGLVFDSENTPQPTDGGRLLIPGTFLEDDYNKAKEFAKSYDPLEIIKGTSEFNANIFNDSAQTYFADIVYLQQVKTYLTMLDHYAKELKDNPITEDLEHKDFKTHKTRRARIDHVIAGEDQEDLGAFYEFIESQGKSSTDKRLRLIKKDQPLNQFYDKMLKLTEFYTDLFMAIAHYRAMVRNNASVPDQVLENIEETENNYIDIMGPNAHHGFIKNIVLQGISSEDLVLPGLDTLIEHLDTVCEKLMSQELTEKINLHKEVDECIEQLRQGKRGEEPPSEEEPKATWPPQSPTMKPQ